MHPETQIQRTQRYLRRLEAKANARARQFLRQARKVRHPSDLPSVMELQDIVRDLGVLSYARGYTARHVEYKPLELAFPSPFDEAVAGVTGMFDEEGLLEVLEELGLLAYAELQRVDASLQRYTEQMLQARTTDEVREIAASFAAQAEARVKTIMRTTTHTAHSAAHYAADQDPAVQEILWGYRYVTAGDERVRDEHAAMDGVTAPKDSPIWDVWWPPNGWNCRCIVVSLFEEQKTVPPESIDGGAPQPDPGFVGNPAQLVLR